MRSTSLFAPSPFGPIFGKELRTTARRKRTYLLRLLYLGTLMLFLLTAYSAAGFGYGTDGVAAMQQRQAQLGQAFFSIFALFGVFAMATIGPILTSTSIGSERVGRTLNVLLMTPINSWQIVSGKLMSRLWIALTLLGLSLPVLALVRLLGSIELEQMFAVICVCMATALVTASFGLFYSTLINRGYAVILMAYMTELFLYAFAPMITSMLLLNHAPMISRSLFSSLWAASNPFFQTGLLLMPGMGRMQWPHQWVWCVATQVVVATLLAMASAAILRRRSRREQVHARGGESEAPLGVVVANAGAVGAHQSTPLPPPLPGVTGQALAVKAGRSGKARRERTVSNNPVLWRESHRPLLTRRWQSAVSAIACIGLLILVYVAVGTNELLREVESQIGFAFVFCGVISLFTCVLAATAVAQEKESQTWTLLLSTPLSARAIVLGKLVGVLRRLMWPMILIVGHFALFTLAGVLPLAATLLILWVIISFNSIWLATGLYLSLRLSKVTLAVIVSILLPFLAYVLIPMVLLIIQSALGIERPGNLTEWGFIYLPYPYLAVAIEYFGRHRSIWVPVGGEITVEQFFITTITVGLGILMLSGLVIMASIRRFNRIVGRAHENHAPGLGAVASADA